RGIDVLENVFHVAVLLVAECLQLLPEVGHALGAEDADAMHLRVARGATGERTHADTSDESADDPPPIHQRPSCAHGKSPRFVALKRRSLASPIRPITMMPKMIWSVASSAWLSVIMWPMPLEAPMSSATIT